MSPTKPTRLPDVEEELLQTVPEQWRQEFVSFITIGDASDAFLRFLDQDVPTQQAVESALADKMRNFERFIAGLNLDPDTLAAHLKRYEPNVIRETSSKVMGAVRKWLSLPSRQKRDVARELADMSEVIDGLDDLKKNLSAVRGPSAERRGRTQ